MKKTLLSLLAASCVACASSASAQIAITFDWGVFDSIFNATPSVVAPGGPSGGNVTMDFYSYDSATGTELADVVAHVSGGGTGPVGGIAGSSGGFGSTLLLGSVNWVDNGFFGSPAGQLAGSPSANLPLGTTTPYKTDLVYAMFTVPGGAVGYVYNPAWVIPDDTSGPQGLNLGLGRNSSGDLGTQGTTSSGIQGVGTYNSDPNNAASGWHATNVPEPGSVALFLTGVAAVAMLRRRR